MEYIKLNTQESLQILESSKFEYSYESTIWLRTIYGTKA